MSTELALTSDVDSIGIWLNWICKDRISVEENLLHNDSVQGAYWRKSAYSGQDSYFSFEINIWMCGTKKKDISFERIVPSRESSSLEGE